MTASGSVVAVCSCCEDGGDVVPVGIDGRMFSSSLSAELEGRS